ncbi:hypothetical protein F503_01190 [Ophiostoma piceae UAMH 11346]|uniref:Uncharacterized protein n=1 Tax=Ophiostoma piceae (strain UAMH 11346) TaxID=1262450 RepID=S3C6H9_OPHP1|nr:hypothetical protein F503_01190 [Ophiostoma piceae UAMH 11346]
MHHCPTCKATFSTRCIKHQHVSYCEEHNAYNEWKRTCPACVKKLKSEDKKNRQQQRFVEGPQETTEKSARRGPRDSHTKWQYSGKGGFKPKPGDETTHRSSKQTQAPADSGDTTNANNLSSWDGAQWYQSGHGGNWDATQVGHGSYLQDWSTGHENSGTMSTNTLSSHDQQSSAAQHDGTFDDLSQSDWGDSDSAHYAQSSAPVQGFYDNGPSNTQLESGPHGTPRIVQGQGIASLGGSAFTAHGLDESASNDIYSYGEEDTQAEVYNDPDFGYGEEGDDLYADDGAGPGHEHGHS